MTRPSEGVGEYGLGDLGEEACVGSGTPPVLSGTRNN